MILIRHGTVLLVVILLQVVLLQQQIGSWFKRIRNVERLLRSTHAPVPAEDMRRLDLIVTGLNIFRGIPLFCDATCITVITGRGAARSGCTRNDGGALRQAERSNNNTYREVIDSKLGRLCCLGVEVLG